MSHRFDEWVSRAESAQLAANSVLAEIGDSKARVAFLKDVSSKLDNAPLDIREYFEEAVLCLQNDLTRSSVVLAWSGFFSIFCEKLFNDKASQIRDVHKKWSFTNSEEWKEYPEAQIIEVAASPSVVFIKKSKKRMLDGWLSQRNQCAHPTVYRPTINTAIGYVDSMVDEVCSLLNSP